MASALQTTAKEKVSNTSKLFGKTKLCKFYAMGGCTKAPQCPFAHGNGELKASPDLRKTSICKGWRSNECSRSAAECPFAHGKSDLRRTTPLFHAKKAALALSKRSSQKMSTSNIQSDDSSTSTLTDSDSKRTLCRTFSNAESSDALDAQSDCSTPSYSAGSLRSPEFEDLSWDPIGMQQPAQPCELELFQDLLADRINSLDRQCSSLEESRQTYNTNGTPGNLNACMSSPPSCTINMSDAGTPSLNGVAILTINHCPSMRLTAMTPILVPAFLAPLGTGADDLERMLRSAQPECYED